MNLFFHKHQTPGGRLSPARVALLYAAFAALWIVASGALLTFAVSDPLLQSRIEIAKGLVFIAVTGGLLYLLLEGWQEPLSGATTVQAGNIAPVKTTRLVLLFTAMALVAPLIGMAIIKLHGPQIEREAYANLQAIAELKAEQIENWLAERNGDSMVLVASSGFAMQVDQFVHGQHDTKLSKPILDRLESLRTNYGYDSALLFDTSGRLLLLLGDEADNPPALQRQLRQTLTSNQVQRGNLYRGKTGHIRLDWAVPISSPQGKRPLALVVLRITAQRFLFPLIQTWPTASPSGETLLVRREGESVLFLNELRHRQDTSLTLKRSLADPELPAAIALRAAKPGITPGKDHRGVSVLAAYRRVAGTDWSIVAKIDRDEVLAPLHELGLWVSLVAFFAIIALSALLLLLWRQQQRMQNLALLAQRTRTDRLLQSSFNEIYLFDADSLLFLQVSEGAKQNLGYSSDELSRLTPLDLKPSFTRQSFEQLIAPLRTGEQQSLFFETLHRRKDGATYPVEVHLELMREERLVFLAIIQNITRRKANEAKIRRLNQLYAALSQCNQAIVRCTSEEELFLQICRVAVQFGGMKMARIGLIDPDTLMLQPAASFGDDTGYLRDIEISADAASPFGRGPTGTAMRENQPFWCQDFLNDPLTAPWRERAAHAGFAALASLPLCKEGIVIGVFSLYAGEINAFDEAARGLLVEMTTDISFALDNFEREAHRKRAQEEINFKNTILQTQQETSLDAILLVDENDQIITYNQQFIDLWQLSPQLVSARQDEPVLQSVVDQVENPAAFIARIQYLYQHRDDKSREEILLKDGRILDRYSSPVTGANGKYYGRVWYFRDITKRKRNERELRIAAFAFETQEGMIVTDAETRILRVNQSFIEITGYTAEEAIGQTPALLQSGRQDKDFYRNLWNALIRDKYWRGEIWNRRKNGEIYPEWLSISAVTNAEGQVTNYIGSFSDISQRKAAEAKIEHLAFYDALTGLPNRRLLHDRLQHTFAVSARHHNHGAVLFIDLDNFKTLNDTKGHNVGDLLLTEVAERLQASVREEDTTARLGGDEFVVVLEDLGKQEVRAAAQAEAVGEKILAAISQPYALDGYEYHSTTSIGISLFCRNDDISVDEVLKHADSAMYQAKSAGRNTLRFYDPAMQAALEAHTALASDLRGALAENQFRLYYQMQADHSGHILGAEVLLRWQHPQHGMVPPLQFIPLAEETGLILPIGQWVLETACAQLKAWEADPLTRELQLAVNVSARQFRQPDFVEQVYAVLEKTAIEPSLLKLELTESLVLDNIDDTIVKMQTLRKVGVRFSMDDFGTGYSSLSYLTQLPLDQLKIDQSFVRNIGVKHSDAVIVQTIIGMASNLGMEVIAEGVETEEQRAFLEQHGCTLCQGYLFGKPVPLEEFKARLKSS